MGHKDEGFGASRCCRTDDPTPFPDLAVKLEKEIVATGNAMKLEVLQPSLSLSAPMIALCLSLFFPLLHKHHIVP